MRAVVRSSLKSGSNQIFQLNILIVVESEDSSDLDWDLAVSGVPSGVLSVVELVGVGEGWVVDKEWSNRSSLFINLLPDFLGVGSSGSGSIGEVPGIRKLAYRGAGT